MHQRTALIGDIGGTHARFAICDIDELSVSHFAVFTTDMFKSLPDAVAHYLESLPERPSIAGFAIAAPVIGDTITMTNAPWSFTRKEVQQACGAERIHFVNDFEALALSLPYLKEHDKHRLGGGSPVEYAPLIVLGPGSGFGCAGLVRHGKAWVPVAGEAGHMSFAARNDMEMTILERVVDENGHAPLQAVLSGRGIEAIHGALAEAEGESGDDATAIEIVRRAFADDEEDGRARKTIEVFSDILARVAGDMALVHGARGGVYIAGGITPKILDILEKDRFRASFNNKGRMSRFLQDIPVFALTAPDAGLRGAAVAVSNRFPMAPAG
ncbi:glucokinase [Oricola thermophila]|uniref:Glucokinase n=1 Tax=Oricola thermophila TaxID=2742145 RepID=A0A6N1VAV0_9HYPH|nr:glucokinase [Oricola thermophila]QKV18141.1 glucokinase [Oricola thermophila]